MTTNVLRLTPVVAGLALLSAGSFAATIPQASQWVDRGLVIDTSTSTASLCRDRR